MEDRENLLGPTCIILTGGGWAGAIGMGMFRVLLSTVMNCLKYILSISVGALDACGYKDTYGSFGTWKGLEKKGGNFLFNKIGVPFHLLAASLFSDHGLKEIVRRVDRDAALAPDAPTIEFSVLQEDPRKWVFFSNKEELQREPDLFPKILRGACALPGFLLPVAIWGRHFSDAVIPDIERAFTVHQCRTVFVCINDQPPSKTAERKNWWARLWSLPEWIVRLRKPVDDLYDLNIIQAIRILQESCKSPVQGELRVFADLESQLPLLVDLKERGLLAPLTAEAFRDAKYRLVLITVAEAVEGLEMSSFKKGAISGALEAGQRAAEKMLSVLGVTNNNQSHT